MKIQVHYLGYIKNLLGKKNEELEIEEGVTLSELLGKLAKTYGQPFKKDVFESGLKDVKTGFVVTVNGILIGQLNGVETKLKEGDNIILMSLMSGG
jgi:MoaD family protein